MPRYGMATDLKKCAGCHGCRVSCQLQNELPPTQAWNRLEEFTSGKFPAVQTQIVCVQCQHCKDAPCVKVCPTGASYKRPDGIVLIDADKCMGCKYCIMACPYEARVFDEAQGVASKCKFCVGLVEQGQLPACVQTCLGKAKTFGDLDDPNSAISKLIATRKSQQLNKELGTGPSIYYLT